MSEGTEWATEEERQALLAKWDEIRTLSTQLRDPQNMTEAQLMSDINADIEATILFCKARAQGIPCRVARRWIILTPAGCGFDPLERALTLEELGA